MSQITILYGTGWTPQQAIREAEKSAGEWKDEHPRATVAHLHTAIAGASETPSGPGQAGPVRILSHWVYTLTLVWDDPSD